MRIDIIYLAAVLIAIALPARAEEDHNITGRELLEGCKYDERRNCQNYISGFLQGMVWGASLAGGDEGVREATGCGNDKLSFYAAAGAALDSLARTSNRDLLDLPWQAAIWRVQMRSFPCGDPS